MNSFQAFRVQFNLRWLFAAVTFCALCAFVYRLTGPWETAFVAVALILLAACVTQWKYRGVWLRSVMLLVSSAMLWMAAVDLSFFHEGCSHCNSHWHRAEIRLLRQGVWSWKGSDHFPTWKLIAEDLGTPCSHDYQRTHMMRLWGMWWPVSPFIQQRALLDHDRIYVRAFFAKVRPTEP